MGRTALPAHMFAHPSVVQVCAGCRSPLLTRKRRAVPHSRAEAWRPARLAPRDGARRCSTRVRRARRRGRGLAPLRKGA